MITFKAWCLARAQNLNSSSDMYNKAHNKFMSTVCAGEANAYKQIAESEWAKRYDSFKEENNRLREALKALVDEVDDYEMDSELDQKLRAARKALKEAQSE
jgi:galactokinase